MKLYNIKLKNESVSIIQAIKKGLGKEKGLFFPSYLPKFSKKEIHKILENNFITRSYKILKLFFNHSINDDDLYQAIKKSFYFSIPLIKILDNIACLELFHGPTLAFKDFGCRFMAQILLLLNKHENKKITILTATSGDTGAAVAHAFYNIKNIRVVILYPRNRVTMLQEKLFSTLGKNIISISFNGTFDDCQELVKQAFENSTLKRNLNLNSANSINISRLLAQICYYFEAVAKISENKRDKLVISVPCGNFGNLTAGYLAKCLGLPIKRFIAATNINNTIPRYLLNGIWMPMKTIDTISNAMDISNPNNWVRIEEIFNKKNWDLKKLYTCTVNEKITKDTIYQLNSMGYVTEPHSAIAYHALQKNIKKNEFGIFLSTAHPIKFKEIVEKIINTSLEIPENLLNIINKKSLSYTNISNFSDLYKLLLN